MLQVLRDVHFKRHREKENSDSTFFDPDLSFNIHFGIPKSLYQAFLILYDLNFHLELLIYYFTRLLYNLQAPSKTSVSSYIEYTHTDTSEHTDVSESSD